MQLSNTEREEFIRLCQAAQVAAKAGDSDEAHQYYRQAAIIHPFSTTVWLGLARVVDKEADRRVALENVLSINPHHTEARRLLDEMNPTDN